MPEMKETLAALSKKGNRQRQLDVSKTPLTINDVRLMITAVNKIARIHTLKMQECQLSTESIAELSKLIHITELHLEGNQLNAAAMKALSLQKNLKKLYVFDGKLALSKELVEPFIKNTTLIVLPIKGKGMHTLPEITLLRKQLIQNNATRRLDVAVDDFAKFKDEVEKKLAVIKQRQIEHPIATLLPANVESAETHLATLWFSLQMDSEKAKLTELNAFKNCFIALFNIYTHASAHSPASELGFAQNRERSNLLSYTRSQSNSAHMSGFQLLTGVGRTIGPRNTVWGKILTQTLPIDNSFTTSYKEFNSNGECQGKTPLYFGKLIGYAGLRKNNAALYDSALSGVNTLSEFKKMMSLVKNTLAKPFSANATEPLTKKSYLLIKQSLSASTLEFYNRPCTLNLAGQQFQLVDQTAKRVMMAWKQTPQLKIHHPPGSAFILIEPLPQLSMTIRSTDNYQEGFINVIIGFFAGILNSLCLAEKNGIFTQRRQSFSFFQPTVTDVAYQFRLSLGLEQDEFSNIVTQALSILDKILQPLDFEKKSPEILALCLEKSEMSKSTVITDKVGNYFRSSMLSDDDKWLAIYESQYLIHEARNELDPYAVAFNKFLENFVRLRVQAKRINPNIDQKPQWIHQSHQLTLFKPEKPGNKPVPLLESYLKNLLHVLHHWLEMWLPKTGDLSFFPVVLSIVLEKLNAYCQKAAEHLNIEKPQTSKLTNLELKKIIHDLLEYWLVLHTVLSEINSDYQKINHVELYRATLLKDFSSVTQLPDTAISLYFNDSGQQALILSIIELAQMHDDNSDIEISNKTSVYLHKDSYYETPLFLSDVLDVKQKPASVATILLVDITMASSLDWSQYKNLKSVILDTTHHPDPNHPQFLSIVSHCQKEKLWLFVATSTLKRQQMGLDKYQSGQIMVFHPPMVSKKKEIEFEPLPKHIDDDLSGVCSEASHQSIAFLLKTIYEIEAYQPQPEVKIRIEEELALETDKKVIKK